MNGIDLILLGVLMFTLIILMLVLIILFARNMRTMHSRYTGGRRRGTTDREIKSHQTADP
jgi:hypothetical protein